MERIKFSHDEEHALEVVRALVLENLRNGRWEHFPDSTEMFQDMVEFLGDEELSKKRFLLLVHEILWELIIQGVIIPGSERGYPRLPFFRVTEHGKKVLKYGEFLPHDPANYLERYQQFVRIQDPVSVRYLKESLRSYNSGCYLSSTMMLGIAAERIFLVLCEVLLNSQFLDEKEKKQLKEPGKMSLPAKFELVRKKMEQLMSQKKYNFPKIPMINLFGIYEFIRVQNNETGGPQENMLTQTRDDVFVSLRIFPQYCKTVGEIIRYLSGNDLPAETRVDSLVS